MDFGQFTYKTIDDLYKGRCSLIPNEKGIYMVIAPDAFDIVFSNQTAAINMFKGRSLLYRADDLKLKFISPIRKFCT